MNSSFYNQIYRRLMVLYRDPKGVIPFKLDELMQKIQMYSIYAFWCRMMAYIWGIRLGSSCRFYGITQFKRYPGSIIRIGDHCQFRSTFRSNMVGINHPCGISTYSKEAEISIGDYCGLSGTVIGAAKSIFIGNHVFCGANVTITDFDWHSLNSTQRENGEMPQAEPVFINDNVWLGLNTLVLKGVIIGKNTVVGANSVVTRSLPENVIAAGIPARVHRVLGNSI